MDEAEGRRREAGIGVWLDGYAKGGARMCNNTTPSAPANSAAARHSDRSTGSNATTAYYASPSLYLSVFPSFHPPSVHPSIRSPLRLLPFVSRSVPTHPPFLPSPFTDPVIHMCVHVVVRNVISALVHENFRGLVEDCLRIFRKPGLLYRDKVLKNDFGIYFCWTQPMQ